MLKIAVVEDDKESSDKLKEYIDKYCGENGEEAQVKYFSDGVDIASEYTADYDIILMDIVMKHMDGLKAAEYIRTMDKDVIIVFITNDARYAIKGYAVEALSFLLKPVSYIAFSQEFGRCVNKIKNRNVNYIVFSTENGMDRVAVDKIIYIESQNHKMIVNTPDRQYCVYDTMRNLENKLSKEQFSRCNNCYLINLAYVKGVHGDFVQTDVNELKISRSRRKGFLDDIAAFFARG